MGSIKAEHGGRVQVLSRQWGVSLNQIIDFSANINPLGPPESVHLAMKEAMQDIIHYPDPEQHLVKQILSERYRVSHDQIVCGNGAAEVLELLIRSLEPNRVFIIEPAFSEYQAIASRYHIPIVMIDMPLRYGRFGSDLLEATLDLVDAELTANDLVIFNHPHNPTGLCWDRIIWSHYILKWSDRGSYVIVDESFIDFHRDEEGQSALSLLENCPGLFIVRSATKMYSIPGLRFGFGFGNKQILKAMEEKRDRWSVNHLAQMAAAWAYQDQPFREETHNWLSEEKKFIHDTWGQCDDIKLFPVYVNFFLAQFQNGSMASQIKQHLEQQYLPVRSCHSFRGLGERYIRVAIRTRPENERLWQEVQFALNKVKGK